MEEGSRLQAVTGRLLDQVEAILDEGRVELGALKQVAAVLKDVRDIQKDTVAPLADTGIRVILEGDVAGFGG